MLRVRHAEEGGDARRTASWDAGKEALMPNQYGDDAVDEILELEDRQQSDTTAKEVLGEAPPPKPKAPQPERRPPERR